MAQVAPFSSAGSSLPQIPPPLRLPADSSIHSCLHADGLLHPLPSGLPISLSRRPLHIREIESLLPRSSIHGLLRAYQWRQIRGLPFFSKQVTMVVAPPPPRIPSSLPLVPLPIPIAMVLTPPLVSRLVGYSTALTSRNANLSLRGVCQATWRGDTRGKTVQALSTSFYNS